MISPRTPGAPTHGPRIGRLSAAYGRTFIPSQHEVAALVAEHRAPTVEEVAILVDRQGFTPAEATSMRLAARDLVVLTEQRQTGKTELIKALMLDRALFAPRRRVWYTAQSGLYARAKWSELATDLCAEGSPLAGYVAVRWRAGDECLTLPNGSTIRPFPPKKDALHSAQADLVIVDEAWKHDPVRGAELLQAIAPAMQTRPGAQLVLTSTMGTAASTWWHGFVDRGRGGDPALTFVEYGIGDDGDPDDLDTVIAAHPGVGHLTTADFIRKARAKLTRNEFARAFGNARTAADERYLDPATWSAAATEDAPPIDAPLTLAGAIAADRSRAAIVACAAGIIEVVDSRPGHEWAGPRMVELARRWHPAAVDVHRIGPSGTLRDHVAAAGVDLADTTPVDYATACVALVDRLAARTLRYRRHANLDAAADAATPAPTGDGGWRWGRRASGGPIPEIEAATLAAWLDTHRPAPPVRPAAYAH